jgi:hypothetical protein
MPETTERRSNWAPWLALLFVLAAIGLNAAVFLGIPGQRVIPWLSLVLGIGAVVCSVIGVRRAFGQSHLYGGKISGCIFGVLALLVCGLLVFATFHARDLPASSGAPQIGQKAPDFALSDTNGNKVSLEQLLVPSQLAGAAGNAGAASSPNTAGNPATQKAVLLIFYRGYW